MPAKVPGADDFPAPVSAMTFQVCHSDRAPEKKFRTLVAACEDTISFDAYILWTATPVHA
jgi:hypothetical protein